MRIWSRNFGRQEDDGDRKDKLAKIVLPDSDPDPNFRSAVLDLSRLGKSFTIMRHAGENRHPAWAYAIRPYRNPWISGRPNIASLPGMAIQFCCEL